jgi:FHS family glucose/mannose:H+ symporter-like MFS transporter
MEAAMAAGGSTRVVALACASFAALGAGIALPGALLPLLVDAFAIRLVEAGSMLACAPIAQLVGTLLAARLVARLGARATAGAGVALLGAGMLGFSLAHGWVAGAALLAVGGLGIGLLEVAVNTRLLTLGGPHASNVLNFTHLFFGVGSGAMPVLATFAVTHGLSWRAPFVLCGAATVAVAAAWTVAPPDPAVAAPPAGAAPARGRRRAALLAACMAVYVGIEIGAGAWIAEYLVRARGAALEAAGSAVAVYWFGLTLGRVALAGLAHRTPPERLVQRATLAATVLLAAALSAPSAEAATVGFAATGLALAGIFPGLIAIGGRWYPHEPARIASRLLIGAGAGSIVVPWAMSAVADRIGVAGGMRCYVAAALAMSVLATAVRRHGAG